MAVLRRAHADLHLYHLMYGKRQTSPCPMCTLWIDGFHGVAHHVAQNADLAIAFAFDPAALRAHARSRGWRKVRLLSCGPASLSDFSHLAEGKVGKPAHAARPQRHHRAEVRRTVTG